MNEHVIQAALGGLLHDIGKFAQRAGESAGQMWDAEAERDYRYKHALLSADRAATILGGRWPEALNAISYHHRPNHTTASRAARIVAIADRLSSGEREQSDEAEPQRLLSIFCRLYANEARQPYGQRYLPLKPLGMDADTLVAKPLGGGETLQEYRALWEGFWSAVSQQPSEDGLTLVNQVMQALLRYAWCIPSAAWRSIPDISLYDHSRMTAALAACLAGVNDTTLQKLLARPDREDTPVALLVGGDVSGIQDFIYTITPRGAAPALRGRSLYVQMLTEAAAHYVLREIGLPASNLVYAGGGHLYLLAPADAGPALVQAQQHISRVLLQHHGGDLYLALAARPLQGADFFGGKLSVAWDEIGVELRRAKDRRFGEIGGDLRPMLFEPRPDEGKQEHECQVCHRVDPRTREEEGWRKCPMCQSFEQLGDDLRRARYLHTQEIEPRIEGAASAAGSAEEVLAALGRRITLTRSWPSSEPSHSGVARSVAHALDDDALETVRPGPRQAVGRKLLVNVTPLVYNSDRQREQVAPNDALAAESRGINRLGVLRMDVDNLGAVFKRGLEERATLSRIAALSLGVSLYFEGYVETLARQFNQEREHQRVYSIYSGGDDLFFVGAWDAIVELARTIRCEFAEYTGHHPNLHLSGGVALVDAHYPLYRAAEEAGDAEKDAKGLEGKNAFTFLGRAMPWGTFEQTATWAATLDQLVRRERAPRSLLRLLMRAQEAYDATAAQRTRDGADRTVEGNPQSYYGPWIPRLEYSLAQMAERHRGIADELIKLRHALRADGYQSIGWIGLAARWAELLNRTREKESAT